MVPANTPLIATLLKMTHRLVPPMEGFGVEQMSPFKSNRGVCVCHVCGSSNFHCCSLQPSKETKAKSLLFDRRLGDVTMMWLVIPRFFKLVQGLQVHVTT